MPEDTTSSQGVAAPGAEREDPARAIGTRLAEIRTRQGVRVSDLARKIGVSASLISQIERAQSRPSVSTLFSLAEALSVPVDAFFRDREAVPLPAATAPVEREPRSGGADDAESSAARRYLVHREDRAVVDIDGGVRWERLTPATLRDLDFLEIVYQPHAESNPTLYRHSGMEMVLVLSGELEIHVAFERYTLGPGDSICFRSTIPHRYVNPSDDVTRAVTVILSDETEPDAGRGPPRL